MFQKAVLICEDVRFEQPGTLTLVGVQGERVGAAHPRLVFVTIVGGLTGRAVLHYRHTLRALDAPNTSREQPMREDAHDPAADEHTLLFGNAPMAFPGAGRYELVTELDANGERATFRYAFRVG